MTTSTPPSASYPKRHRRWRTLLAGGIATAFAAVGVLGALPAAATGTGPVWTTYWAGNGSTASSSANSIAGVWNGSPAYVPYPGNSDGNDLGFSFDGTNYVSGAPALGNLGSANFTVNLDVTTTQSDGLQHDLISTRAICGGGPFWQVYIDGSGHVVASFYGTDGQATSLANPTAVNDGSSHDIAITRNGSTLSLSVDSSPVTATVNGTGDYTTINQHVNLGGGNGCTGVAQLRPFVGAVDYLYLTQGNDPAGQDLQLTQPSTPSAPAGGSGSLVVHRLDNSQSWTTKAAATFHAPAGVTFTSVTDNNSTCSVTNATTVTCAAGQYGPTPGTNTLTIGFDVASSATPGATLNVIGDFTNQSNTDPDHSNDHNVPLAIHVASTPGAPLADPMILAGLAGGGLLVVAGWFVARRRRARA